jgi:hypothetical protein
VRDSDVHGWYLFLYLALVPPARGDSHEVLGLVRLCGPPCSIVSKLLFIVVALLISAFDPLILHLLIFLPVVFLDNLKKNQDSSTYAMWKF